MLLLPGLEHKFDFLLEIPDGAGKRFGFDTGIDDRHAVVLGVVAVPMRLFENWLVPLRCGDGVLQ